MMNKSASLSLGYVEAPLLEAADRLSVKLTNAVGTSVSRSKAIKVAVMVASSDDPTAKLDDIMHGAIDIKEIK